MVTNPSSTSQYIVRYQAGGTYDWSHVVTDVQNYSRQITLAGDTAIYYSGRIFDSSTLGTFHYNRPTYGGANIVARIDSGGTVEWLTQLDTTSGYSYVSTNPAAVLMPDGSLSLYTGIRGYLDWGNGITSFCGSRNDAAVTNYAATTGLVNWVKPIAAKKSLTAGIAASGWDVWVTGTAYDSSAYGLDDISVSLSPLTYTPYMALLHTSPYSASVPAAPAAPQFGIYPIPATHTLYITSPAGITGDVRITITDISGKVVMDKLTADFTTLKLPVSTYDRGLYFITISSTTYTATQKLILE